MKMTFNFTGGAHFSLDIDEIIRERIEDCVVKGLPRLIKVEDRSTSRTLFIKTKNIAFIEVMSDEDYQKVNETPSERHARKLKEENQEREADRRARIVELITDAFNECYSSRMLPTTAHILEHIGEFNGNKVTKSQLVHWTRQDWCPFKRNSCGVFYTPFPFDEDKDDEQEPKR